MGFTSPIEQAHTDSSAFDPRWVLPRLARLDSCDGSTTITWTTRIEVFMVRSNASLTAFTDSAGPFRGDASRGRAFHAGQLPAAAARIPERGALSHGCRGTSRRPSPATARSA